MGEPAMNRDLFEKMLSAQPGIARDGDAFEPEEQSQLSVLLQAVSGGPVPLTKVRTVRLADDFVTVETEDAAYVLPYAHLAGLKLARRGEVKTSRTGFRA